MRNDGLPGSRFPAPPWSFPNRDEFADYRGPHQLPAGPVLVVGAGSSGADIAVELARDHSVILSGRHPGQIPWRIGRTSTRALDLLAFFAFSHVLTIATPPGRRMRTRSLAHSGPLIRVKTRDLVAAGVDRAPRTAGVADGRPVLGDGRVPEVASVIWCTGYTPDHSWIDLPVLDADGSLIHERGVCPTAPGRYALGQMFQYALASSMVHGVGRDAAYLADRIEERTAGRGESGRGRRQTPSISR